MRTYRRAGIEKELPNIVQRVSVAQLELAGKMMMRSTI